MIDDMLSWVAHAILIGATTGFWVGLTYFRHLRTVAARILDDRARPSLTFMVILRIGATVFVFFLLTLWSAAAATAGLVGFTVARQLVLAEREGG